MRNVARDRRIMCVGCFDQNVQIFQTPTRREFCIGLKEAQFDIFELKAAGFSSVGDLKSAFDLASLKSEFDLASLKSEFDLASLKSEFDLASLKSEFDLASLKSAGFDFSALVSAGFSAAELTAVGFASEVKVCLLRAAPSAPPRLQFAALADSRSSGCRSCAHRWTTRHHHSGAERQPLSR